MIKFLKISVYNYIKDNNKIKELQRALEELLPEYYITESIIIY